MELSETEITAVQAQLDAAAQSMDQVRIAAEFALSRLNAASESARKTSTEIADYVYDKLELDLRIGKSSFPPYLSTLVGSAQSSIVSTGARTQRGLLPLIHCSGPC